MCRLEAAIDQIEADFLYDGLPASSPVALPDMTGRRGGNLLASRGVGAKPSDDRAATKTNTFGADAIHDRSLLFPSGGPSALPLPSIFGAKRGRNFWRNIQIAGAVVIGLILFAVIDFRHLIRRAGQDLPREAPVSAATDSSKERSSASPDKALVSGSVAKLPSRPNDLLVPKEYGAYAVVNGKLAELEQLSIRVPDPRVAISAAIQTPSRTHLPAGQVQFIIFRRDLMNNAPDRVTVRVMAQIVRALSFNSRGNAKTSQVEQSWVIRNNSYSMKVAPLGDNPEMVVIRSDPADLSLPAGRYVLVLKSVGYDFTVDGGATDQAHCLERTDALSAPIYSECRKL